MRAQTGCKTRVGIVGGGKGGLEMLRVFSVSQDVQVAFIVDRDLGSVAMIEGKKLGISLSTDLPGALKSCPVDFVIEATGVEAVAEVIREHLPERAELLSSKASLLFFNVLAENRRRSSQDAFEEISSMSTEIAQRTRKVKEAVTGITKVATNLEMLAINASIEAARAGERGRGFAVVAEAVKGTAREAKLLLGDIESVNENNSHMSQRLDKLLQKMR